MRERTEETGVTSDAVEQFWEDGVVFIRGAPGRGAGQLRPGAGRRGRSPLRTLHGAPPNPSTLRRRAISIRYCGDDARYRIRPGAPQKSHHRAVCDGDPLGGEDCPQVWPRG